VARAALTRCGILQNWRKRPRRWGCAPARVEHDESLGHAAADVHEGQRGAMALARAGPGWGSRHGAARLNGKFAASVRLSGASIACVMTVPRDRSDTRRKLAQIRCRETARRLRRSVALSGQTICRSWIDPRQPPHHITKHPLGLLAMWHMTAAVQQREGRPCR
jgi:hypothetical protein